MKRKTRRKLKNSLLIQKIIANRSRVLSIKTIMNIVPTKEIKEQILKTLKILRNKSQKKHSAGPYTKHSGEQNREDNNEINDESENSPLWSMIFDGSCSKTSA